MDFSHQKDDYNPEQRREEDETLRCFLNMPVSSSEAVFAKFRTLPGAVEAHGTEKEGYLYVPGTRHDRCVLAAHADTYFDEAYMGELRTNQAVLQSGFYRGTSSNASIGADDRAGCAMLWLLRDTGHSLLILDGEEHGQVGAHFLEKNDPALFGEINTHSFILQLDRRGSRDLCFYKLPVSEPFQRFIADSTGYVSVSGPGRTDICALCTDVCGVNLSVGYYDEHKPEETLAVEEWRHTLHVVQKLLDQPLKRYALLK